MPVSWVLWASVPHASVSRRSHFGSATDPVASLWSGGINRLTPTHPLGNNDEFQGVSPLFQRPELLSARAAPWFGGLLLIGNLASCSSFELYAVVAFKGVGTSLPTEITEIRDRHRTRRHLLLAIGGARVRDQLLANHAGDRQRKFRPGVLVSTMRLKADASLQSHLVEPHIGI